MIAAERWGDNGQAMWQDIFAEALVRLREHRAVLMEVAGALETAPPRGHVPTTR